MSKLFGHGDLRLWLLKLIHESPRHGYEIISALEEQFLGLYSPSPGTVYPRLAALEGEGLIEVVREEEGRKIYALTDAGREELERRADELRQLGDHLARSAKDIAREIREDVKASVRDLKEQVRMAAREVRRDQRREARVIRETASTELKDAARRARSKAKEAKDVGREASDELRDAYRSLQSDLEGFVADVVAAARRRHLDRDRLDALRAALREARAAVVDALETSEDRSKR